MPLTKAQIDRLAYNPAGPKRQVHYDGKELPGFGVMLHPSGRKVFILQYRPRDSRTPRLLTLGQYGALTLAQARKEAQKELHAARFGADPLEKRRAEKRGETLRDLAAIYMKREGKSLKTATEVQRLLDKHILPALGSKRVKDITTEHCAQLHFKIGDTAPIGANRVRGVLHRLFECARKWGYAPPDRLNPVRDVEPFKERSRERFADAQELPHLWRAIEAEADPHTRAVFKILLLTGCRRGEVLGLRWRDVDVGARVLRLRDTKAGTPATVPLSDEALAVLAQLDRGIGDAPIFPVATTKRAWDRVRARLWLYQNPDAERRLRKRAEADVARAPKHAARGPEAVDARLLTLALPHAKEEGARLTLHDLRRTAGSLMALHTTPTVVGKVLRNPTAVPIYTRIADQEARRALEDHGKRLAAIVSGRD
jgi:integrase